MQTVTYSQLPFPRLVRPELVQLSTAHSPVPSTTSVATTVPITMRGLASNVRREACTSRSVVERRAVINTTSVGLMGLQRRRTHVSIQHTLWMKMSMKYRPGKLVGCTYLVLPLIRHAS